MWPNWIEVSQGGINHLCMKTMETYPLETNSQTLPRDEIIFLATGKFILSLVHIVDVVKYVEKLCCVVFHPFKYLAMNVSWMARRNRLNYSGQTRCMRRLLILFICTLDGLAEPSINNKKLLVRRFESHYEFCCTAL